MPKERLGTLLKIGGLLLGLWLAVQYLLPLFLPFLIGAVLALVAEPAVRVGVSKVRLRRCFSSAIGVSMTLLLMVGAVSLLGAFLVKELTVAARTVPDVGKSIQQGIQVLEDWMIHLTNGTPEGIRPSLQKVVLDTFDGGSALVEQVSSRIPGALAAAVGWLSEGALTIGTGVIAGFMISARLPKLKAAVKEKLPGSWHSRYLPALQGMKASLGAWLRAQLKLMLVTWGILTVGFLLLWIPYGPMWAALVAVVDAVPVLGTGTVLVPWALVEFLQGRPWQGIGLLGIFGATWLARTVLEPRLVGRHLGLDPLVTLGAFYVGFRLWGIPGMILSPILAAVVKGLLDSSSENGEVHK